MDREIIEIGSLSELLDVLKLYEVSSHQKRMIIDRYIMDKARMSRTPYAGGFELTPLCNLDCKMCYVHLKAGQMDRSLLTGEQWKQIIGQAIENGLIRADLTGGECLTHPDFKEIYLYLLSQGIKVTVLTNGALLNDEYIRFFSEYKPELIQITLYASTRKGYIEVTGHDVFEQIVESIKRIRDSGIPLRITVTPNRYMRNDAISILDLIRSLNVDYGIGSVTLPARKETGRRMEDYSADSEVYRALFRNEHDYRMGLLAKVTSSSQLIGQKEYIFRPKGLEAGGMPCASGMCTFHVNWKGEMTPCIPFSNIGKSILVNGFKESWKYLTELMGGYSEPEECRECDKRRLCESCPAEKTFGELGGRLNTAVCERLKCFIDEGIVAGWSENQIVRRNEI